MGNPGREYARHRHNAGYMVVDELARRHAGSWKSTGVGRREVGVHGGPVAFGSEAGGGGSRGPTRWPSGRSVGAAAAFFKVEPADVLIVHDEGDFDLGRLELKFGGGLAGHNGLRSIAEHLRTQEFARLRIGVGRPERGDPRTLADYVLADFEPHDDADALITRAADAVEDYVRH